MQFKRIPVPEILRDEVECIRISEHAPGEEVAIKVCPNGFPGIVFQHQAGRSAIENIVTPGRVVLTPTLFVYGQVTTPSVMHFKHGPYTTTQVILKPHALSLLLGVDASALTNNSLGPEDFDASELNARLMESADAQQSLALLAGFLYGRFQETRAQDALIQESLRFIRRNIGTVTVKALLAHLNLSERQFEKRFARSVGVSPQFYIRLKRFNEAIHLMKTRPFQRLTDVAYALNYYDQSHFIRDIKAFSGITPKSLSQRVDDFHPDQPVYTYL